MRLIDCQEKCHKRSDFTSTVSGRSGSSFAGSPPPPQLTSLPPLDASGCQVTLSGSGQLLLSKTVSSDFISHPERARCNPRVFQQQLQPLSVYAMTGMSR